jgi:hypothetical protein
MEELVAGFLIAVFGGATTAALLTLVVILLPNLTRQTTRVTETMLGRSLILGTINFIFFFGIAIVLSRIGDGIGGFFGGIFSLIALFIVLALVLLLSVGLSALVRIISERSNESRPVTNGRLFRSAVLLVGAALAPLAGWFVLAPLVLFISLGATILALVHWVGARLPRNASPKTAGSA